MRINKVFILLTAFIMLLEFASLGFFALAPAAKAEVLSPAQQMKAEFENNKNLDVRNQLRVPFPQWENLGEPTWEPCSDSTEANPKLCMRIPWIAAYIGNLYKYGIVIGSILAVMMIMIGGVIYMTGGANPTMITRGKEYIVGAVTGIILLLGSYILLNTINPDLINLKTIDVEVVKEQLIVPDDCDYIIAKKDDKLKDKLTVPGYPSGKTCGDQFDVKVDDKFKSEFKVDSDTKCTGRRCSEAGKGCTDSLSGKFECVPAYAIGSVTNEYTNEGLARAMQQAGLSTSENVGLGVAFNTRADTAYVTKVELRNAKSNDKTGKSNFQTRDKKYIILSDAQNPPQTDELYYLLIQVNDIKPSTAWAIGSTSDDEYKLNKNGQAEAIDYSRSKPVCCVAKCASNQTAKFTVENDPDCSLLMKKEDLNNVAQIQIDTEKFYCSTETLFDSTIVDDGTMNKDDIKKKFRGDYCFNATDLKKVGDPCTSNDQCKSNACYQGFCNCLGYTDCPAGKICGPTGTPGLQTCVSYNP